MTLEELNRLEKKELKEALAKCCGSATWVAKMTSIFPVEDKATLLRKAEEFWFACNEADWREAFAHHPKIGDLKSLKEKYASTSKWAEGEQAGVKSTTPQALEQLAEGNRLYKEKFGYIFIVCATGKSAEEMLRILRSRLPNNPEEEIKIAMSEQNKITKLRLEKLLSS
ncbi:MAG: 2-oxo-4-hydroxy-4-carboxy-5-ureidoimidazoline decarboxylase [Flavisolibacter sp.]|nr:2-oxo-4-hydroxy-4-carboxy-5-ureidoimidazoline decarboxylase [Flavisolibacter sp.]